MMYYDSKDLFLLNILRIDIAVLKEMLHKKEIDKIHWIKKEHHLADSSTKIGGDVSPLINTLIYGKLYDPE